MSEQQYEEGEQALEQDASETSSITQVASSSRQERLADVDFNADHALRPFYEGHQVDTRMQQIRKAIVQVRENWHNYDLMMDKLKLFIQQLLADQAKHDQACPSSGVSAQTQKLLNQIYSTKLDWIEQLELHESDTVNTLNHQPHAAYDHSLILLYTTAEGYKLVFKLVYDQVLRNDAALLDQDRLLVAVFLIELFNIQLYNLCVTDTTKSQFTGTVYRGMSTDQQMLLHHCRLFQSDQPVAQRYVSIPLSLQSHTLSFDLARKFSQPVANSTSCHSIVFRIDVIAMLPDLLQEYRQRYPVSVVSSICAVPISSLSCFQHELEVVLRGAFYQLLSMRMVNDGEGDGDDVFWLVDGVVVNANRDHISTTRLGALDGEARAFFAAAAKATRYTYALNYARVNALLEDARQFEELLQAANQELDVIRKTSSLEVNNS